MADVKWIKIITDIFDDEKIKLIDSMPDNDAIIVIWFKLLAQAGKSNQNGALFLNSKIAYTDEMLATVFNRKLLTVRLALDTLDQFNMIERGDYIQISNWEKHQNIEGMDKIRIQTNERVKKYREKQKQLTNNNVTLCNVSVTHLDKELEEELDIELKDIKSVGGLFNNFWSNYPRKVGKDKCLRWFKSHKVDDEFVNVLLKAIETQKQSNQWLKDSGQYIPHPYTWLNRGGWTDELKLSNIKEPDWMADYMRDLAQMEG